MTAPRFARGTKSRIFLYVGLLAFVGIAVCIFHETQSRMDEVRKGAEKCQQQQESLAAQLQVIFEYKLRLEKSVQQEKAEHRHTREELQGQLEEERTRRAKEVLEATNKLASLQQHYKLLQGQHEDLAEECSKVRVTGSKAAEARARAENQLLQLRSARDKEAELLKTQLLQLRTENDRLMKQAQDAVNKGQQAASLAGTLRLQNVNLQSELSQVKLLCPGYSSKAASAAPAVGAGHLQSPQAASPSSSSFSLSRLSAGGAAEADQNVLHQPDAPNKSVPSPSAAHGGSPSTNANKSVPRGNNQVAPMPAPGPPEQDNVGAKPLVAGEGLSDEWQRIPPGVVPAPNVYHDGANFDALAQHQLFAQNAKLQLARAAVRMQDEAGGEESHQIAQPLPPGHALHQPHAANLFEGMQRRDAEADEGDVEESKAVGAAPPEQQGEHKLPPQQPAWKAAGEEEEEGREAMRLGRPGQVYRQYQPQDNYKEEEGELDDRGGAAAAVGRWPADNQPGEHAPGEPHEDLQLEDVEEDDDDDVDQIDYGNEVHNNGVAKHKQARKAPLVAKHESVMVNPK